jgi:hypothetical protein
MMGRTCSYGIEDQVTDLSGRREQRHFHCLGVMRITKTAARIDHDQSCFTAGCAIEIIDRARRGSLHADAPDERDSFAAQAGFHYCLTGARGRGGPSWRGVQSSANYCRIADSPRHFPRNATGGGGCSQIAGLIERDSADGPVTFRGFAGPFSNYSKPSVAGAGGDELLRTAHPNSGPPGQALSRCPSNQYMRGLFHNHASQQNRVPKPANENHPAGSHTGGGILACFLISIQRR